MATTVDSLEAVKADVYAKMRPKIEALMKDIVEEIESHYEEFVESWYSSYDPKEYDRTFDTFYGSSGFDNYATNYSVVETDDGFDGDASIVVTPFLLHGYYHDPVDYVFTRSWGEGIHGTLGTGGKTTPPKSDMDKWFEGFKNTIPQYIRSHGLLS